MLAIFQTSHWRVFRGIVVFWTVFSFLFGQAVYAGALDNMTGVKPYQTDEDLKKEGFVGEEYVDQLKGRETFQREKMKEMTDIREGFQNGKKNLLKQMENVEDTAEQIKQVNEMQNQKSLGSLRRDSEKNASLVASYGRKFIKYGDGKKVWTFGGLVTDVENERIYDKHGNLSIRNTRNMKYDNQYQMVSYESDTVDSLGNKTSVKWSGGLYWTKQDEAGDTRKKAGQLASFKEVRTDEIGVENEAVWKDILYYTDSDELKNEAHQSGQMAGYKKTEVNEASPERMDTIETTDIEYLKRNILIYPKSDDPKEKDRRKRQSEQYETLMTGFHETRETFGVVTEREWRNARYNDFSELTCYEERSSTLGVDTDKNFAWASYDEYGRMDSFKEVSTTYGSETEKTRLYTDYNNENQVVGYGEESITDGVLTSIVRDQMTYNDMNQLMEYHEILTNSEGYERELMRYGMEYDLRGLMTHYVDEYDENGIHWTVERSDISYNENGFLSGYYETRHESAEYLAPDGELVVIDRTTVVERLSTDYNGNGLESAYHERITDTIGLVTDVYRSEMEYEGDKLTAYHEKREIRGKLKQSALKVNSLSQFEKSGDEWVGEDEELEYGYTLEKKFYGAKYSGGKLVEYTEEETDSRKDGATVTRHRYDQVYGSNGKVLSYKEDETTEVSGEKSLIAREWKEGLYDAQGRLLSYKEITKDSLGAVTEKVWKALSYNAVSLIESYSEEVLESGESTLTERSRIKYNGLDQMLYYQEKIHENSGVESQKTWQTLKGYNSVGLLKDWKETTVKGALTTVLYRHHMVYSRLGGLRQYIQEQEEEGGYQNILGQQILISRKSLFERVDTLYDDQGREKEYWEFRRETNGMEASTHRKDITYHALGGVKSYQEDTEYKGSYLSDSINEADPPTLRAGGLGNAMYAYTVTRNRLDSLYDAGGKLLSYNEAVVDSRKPGLTTLIERSGQQYTSVSGQLTHYEENKTLRYEGEAFVYSTVYDAEYHPAGMLLKSTERVTDFLRTIRLQTYEALTFNAVNLAESTLEVSLLEDAGQKISEVIKQKSAILYDGLDQKVSYQETQKDGQTGQETSRTEWTGSYYAGTDLLRAQTTKTTEGDLVKTQAELARIYDALGRLTQSLASTMETSDQANLISIQEGDPFKTLYDEADALNPTEMNAGGDLLQTALAENYRIEILTLKKDVTYDLAGNESGYQESRIQRENESTIQTTVTTRQVADQLIDGRLTEWTDTQGITCALASGSISYQTVTKNRVEAWNSGRGQASKTYALTTDSRKAEAGETSQWSEEKIRDSIVYDSNNRVLSYMEAISEKAADGSLETSLLIERTATQYDLQGREIELLETRTELYEGASGVEVSVEKQRSWKGLYSSIGLLENYEEQVTYPVSGAVQNTKRDTLLYDHLGREKAYREIILSADGTEKQSLTCLTSYDGSSKNLLSSTQVTHTTELDVAEFVIRSGMSYDTNGNLKAYQEDVYDYGQYYVLNYSSERGALGQSLSPLSSTQRVDTLRNTLGQVAAYSEIRTDSFGIETATDRTDVQYSSKGQETGYHEESRVTGTSGGVTALSYTLSRDYSVETFNNLGLAASTDEKTSDSRKSGLAAEITKTLEYNASALLVSGFTQVNHEYEVDASGMIAANPAYDLTVTSVRSAMIYDKGRLKVYNEETVQGMSLTYESGEWTRGEKEKETLEWSASFIEGTSLYTTVTEKRTQGGLITLSEKSLIQYNALGQEIAYKTVSTDASGWQTTLLTSSILYNTLGQQSAFDTLTRSQGVETTSRRSQIQYNLSGQTLGYEEIRREKDESGLNLGLDRITLSERLLQVYNGFGQMISYSETALTPFGFSEISVLASGFSSADYLSLGITDIFSQYMRTTTLRNQMKYTKENQLYAYHEDISVTGFLDQAALALSNDYTGLAPEGAVSNVEADVSVSTERHHDYKITAFDTKGREVSSIDTEEKIWTDASGNPHTLTQNTVKKNITYDQNGRIQSYLQTVHLFDSDLSLLNKKTVTERKSTQYSASGKTLQTDEILTDYEADAQTILEVSEKIWNGTYYEGTDTLSKTVEQTTIIDSNPAILKGLKTTKIREGLLSNPAQTLLGITYNECGLEESYAEVEYQENILTGEKASYATVNRVAETVYNDFGKLVSQRKETGTLTGEFDDAALSLWKKDAVGNWALNGTYVLTSQSKWGNGVYDAEGNLIAYHQVTMPFGIDFPGFSTQAQQTENLYSAPSHIFFQNAVYDAFGRQISSLKTTWDYYDDTDSDGVEEGVNQREDERIEDCVYDALGRLTGNTEYLRTRQGSVDYFTKTMKTSTYGGMIQTGSESIVFTESAANVSYADTDPRAYGVLAVKRCFSEITYDSLMRQASYTYSETEGGHDTAEPFVFIPDSTPKEVYTRSGIDYDARGRLDHYVDSYAWKDYVEHTEANKLTVTRSATTYHDGNETEKTSGAGYLLADDHKGKIKYYKESIIEGGVTENKEYSMEYFSTTGLLDKKHEYIDKWKLTNAVLDSNGRFASYTGECLETDASGNETVFKIVKDNISYESDTPGEEGFFTEKGFSGSIFKDAGNDKVFELSFSGLSIDGMDFIDGHLTSYHEFFKDDLSASSNDVEITKSAITENGYRATIVKEGQTFYVERTFLEDEKDAEGNPLYHRFQDIYYTESAYAALLNLSITRTYYFEIDENITPSERLAWFLEENEGGVQTKYTAIWNGNTLESFDIEGSGANAFQYRNLTYYRWWSPYRGQISSFRIEDGKNTRVDLITYDMTQAPPAMTGYRLRQDGSPDRVYSHLTDSNGFTLVQGGQTYSEIKTSLVNGQVLVSSFVHQGNKYSNITYDTTGASLVVTGYDVTASDGIQYKNVSLSGNTVTAYTLVESGSEVRYSSVVWNQDGKPSGFTRTIAGVSSVYSGITCSGSNVTAMSVTTAGVTTAYTFGEYTGTHYGSMTKDINADGTFEAEFQNITYDGNGNITGFQQRTADQNASFDEDGKVQVWQIFSVSGGITTCNGAKVVYDYDRDGNGTPETFEAKYTVDAEGNEYLTGYDMNFEYFGPYQMIQMKVSSPGFGYMVNYSQQPWWETPDVDGNFTESLGSEFMFSKPSILPGNGDIEDYYDSSTVALNSSVFMPAALSSFSVGGTGSLITADSLVLNAEGVNEPITKLKTNSLTPALSSYRQIEKEKLLQQMGTFSSKEVVTTEYMYDEFGQVTGIKTQTFEGKTGKVLESSERTKITVDKLGRTLTFEEKQVDSFGTEKNIKRLETKYDGRGNVLSYKQITETKKSSSKTGTLETEVEKNAAELSEAESLLETGYENIEVAEAVETVLETVENQIYNDKRELLQYTRKTEITKEGTLENGEKITARETQTSENTLKYDTLGRVIYSEEKTRSSSTPDLVTTQIKSGIRYDEQNREKSYSLQVNELALDSNGNTLSSVTSFVNRLDTRYDVFGRVLGYTEERYTSQASRKETVTRSNTRYNEQGQIKSYEEQYTYGSGAYTRSVYKTDISYDRYGNEANYRQLEKVKDASLNAETTLITERRGTVTDAFGNLVKKVERTLGLKPDEDIVMENFFQGGELPEGVVTEIVFEAGSLDEFGRVVGYRQTTATALGKIDFEGKFENTSILERVSQKTDSAGRPTETVEKQWTSQEPALVSQITTKDITYTKEGQKSGQTKETVKQGAYANPVSGATENYYVKETSKIESLAYDPQTGEVKGSVTLNTRYDGKTAVILSQTRVSENIKNTSASGKILSMEKKTDTLEGGKVASTEELKTDYTYDRDFTTSEENTLRTVTENNEVVVSTETKTENQTDQLGRAVRQLITANDLLRNEGRKANNLEEMLTTTERRMSYNAANQATSIYTCTLEAGKTGGEIKSGSVTLEENIRYTGAGTRASYETTTYTLSSETLKNNLKVNLESLLESFKSDRQSLVLPAVPAVSVFGINAAGGAAGSAAVAPVKVMGLESSLFTKSGTQKTEVLSCNLDGASAKEKVEGTTITASGTEIAFTETRDSIVRDSRGNIKSMNVTRQEQGRIATEYKVLDREYNAAGRLTLEKIAEPAGMDSKGNKTYAVTTKSNITYDFEGRTLTYTSLRTAPDGGMQKTQRLSTKYDAEGQLTQYAETTASISSNHVTLTTKGSLTRILSRDADGRVLEQQTESGVISDQAAFETALKNGGDLKKGLREKTYSLASETMEYDSLGRTVSTHTETANHKGLKTVTDYKVLSMDDSGRVLSTSSKTVDAEGKTTTAEESGILYNKMNQRTQVIQKNTDAKGKTVVTKLSNMTYDLCGRLKSQTSIDLEGGNSNPMTTRDITYNAAGQRTAYIVEGKNKEGQPTFESRTGMSYNADGELAEYYSSGSSNGYSFNKHLTGISYDEKGRMSAYNESGLTAEGVSYNENHSSMVYDAEDRVTQERVSGTRAGDKVDETTKTQYNNDGKVTCTETRSNINSDYSITSNISYDARGNRTSYTTQGSKDGKTFSSTTKTSYAYINGYDRLVSKVESGTRSDGKAYTEVTSGYSYNKAGQLKAYTQNVEIRGDKDYVKTVSNIEYNNLGQMTSMSYTDTRNNDFKVRGNTITETYSYNSNGKQTGSTMTTPDYVIRYDGNGKQIGQAQETAAYRQWREAEEARAYQEAREQAEAELLNGLAGSTVILDANNQPVNNALVAQMLGGSGMYGNNIFMSSMGMMNTGKIASFKELMGTLGKGNNQAISLQLAQYATAIAPQQYQAALQTAITREMIAAKVNEKTANLRQELMNILSRAIAQAVPSGAAKNALLAKIKQSMGTSRMFDRSGALVLGTQMLKSPTGNRFYVNGKEVSKAEYAKNAQLKGGKEMNLDLMQELDLSSPEVAEQRCKQLQQALGKNAANIAWPLKVCSYDDNGRLQGLEEFSLEKSKDGTTHVKRDYKKYDEAGYVTEKRTFETYKGPNQDVKVDTKYNNDGSTESHVWGTEKSEKTGQMEKVDRTIKIRSEAIDGGFRTIQDATDNLTGLKSTTTDTFTGCQYAGGKLIAFNLTHAVKGQQMQNGVVTEINILETTRQYDAQVDGKGNLLSYKQDVWSNSSPDKHTTMQYNNNSFDSEGRTTSQTIQTWEKGKGKDSSGNTVDLNSFKVQERSNIKYNSFGQMESYDEKTYTQKQCISFDEFQKNCSIMTTAWHGEDMQTEGIDLKQIYEAENPTTITTSGGNFIKAFDGYKWTTENTSQSSISYDYGGRMSFWKDSNGKAHHQTYDINGLVSTSYTNATHTREYDIKYDSTGRKSEWSSKTSGGQQSYYGTHKAEYNGLGQIISQTDEVKSSGAYFKHHEKTQTFYTYDAQGTQKETGTTLFFKSHSKHSFFTRLKEGDSKSVTTIGIASAFMGPEMFVNFMIYATEAATIEMLPVSDSMKNSLQIAELAFSPSGWTMTPVIAGQGATSDFAASNQKTFNQVCGAIKTVCSAIAATNIPFVAWIAALVGLAVATQESLTNYSNGLSSEEAIKQSAVSAASIGMAFCGGQCASYASAFAVQMAGNYAIARIQGQNGSDALRGAAIAAAISIAAKFIGRGFNRTYGTNAPGTFQDALIQGVKNAGMNYIGEKVAEQCSDPRQAAMITAILSMVVQGIQEDGDWSGADGKALQEAIKGAVNVAMAGRVDGNGNLSKDEQYLQQLMNGIVDNIDFGGYFDAEKKAEIKAIEDSGNKDIIASYRMSDDTLVEIKGGVTTKKYKNGTSEVTIFGHNSGVKRTMAYDKNGTHIHTDVYAADGNSYTRISAIQEGHAKHYVKVGNQFVNDYDIVTVEKDGATISTKMDKEGKEVLEVYRNESLIEKHILGAKDIRDNKGNLLKQVFTDEKTGVVTWYSAKGEFQGGMKEDKTTGTTEYYGKDGTLGSREYKDGTCEYYGLREDGKSVVVKAGEIALFNGMGGISGILTVSANFLKADGSGYNLGETYLERDVYGRKKFEVEVNGDRDRYKNGVMSEKFKYGAEYHQDLDGILSIQTTMDEKGHVMFWDSKGNVVEKGQYMGNDRISDESYKLMGAMLDKVVKYGISVDSVLFDSMGGFVGVRADYGDAENEYLFLTGQKPVKIEKEAVIVDTRNLGSLESAGALSKSYVVDNGKIITSFEGPVKVKGIGFSADGKNMVGYENMYGERVLRNIDTNEEMKLEDPNMHFRTNNKGELTGLYREGYETGGEAGSGIKTFRRTEWGLNGVKETDFVRNEQGQFERFYDSQGNVFKTRQYLEDSEFAYVELDAKTGIQGYFKADGTKDMDIVTYTTQAGELGAVRTQVVKMYRNIADRNGATHDYNILMGTNGEVSFTDTLGGKIDKKSELGLLIQRQADISNNTLLTRMESEYLNGNQKAQLLNSLSRDQIAFGQYRNLDIRMEGLEAIEKNRPLSELLNSQFSKSLGDTCLGAGVVVGVLGSTALLVGAPIALTLGMGMMAYGMTTSGSKYYNELSIENEGKGVNLGQAFTLALGEMVGINQIVEAATAEDIVSGKTLYLNERSSLLGEGYGALVITLGTLPLGAKDIAALKSETFGSLAMKAIEGTKNPFTEISRIWESTGEVLDSLNSKLGKLLGGTEAPANNPLPADGLYARAMNENFVQSFLEGRNMLSNPDPKYNRNNETFLTTATDIADVKTPKEMQQRLSLYKDFESTLPNNSANTVIVFEKPTVPDGIATPVNSEARGYGNIGTGKTGGGTREFVIPNANIKTMTEQGFKIKEIYTLNENGGKISWDFVANKDGTYSVLSKETQKVKELKINNMNNLNVSSIESLQLEIGRQPVNVKNADSIGMNTGRVDPMENTLSSRNLRLKSSSEDFQMQNSLNKNGGKTIWNIAANPDGTYSVLTKGQAKILTESTTKNTNSLNISSESASNLSETVSINAKNADSTGSVTPLETDAVKQMSTAKSTSPRNESPSNTLKNPESGDNGEKTILIQNESLSPISKSSFSEGGKEVLSTNIKPSSFGDPFRKMVEKLGITEDQLINTFDLMFGKTQNPIRLSRTNLIDFEPVSRGGLSSLEGVDWKKNPERYNFETSGGDKSIISQRIKTNMINSYKNAKVSQQLKYSEIQLKEISNSIVSKIQEGIMKQYTPEEVPKWGDILNEYVENKASSFIKKQVDKMIDMTILATGLINPALMQALKFAKDFKGYANKVYGLVVDNKIPVFKNEVKLIEKITERIQILERNNQQFNDLVNQSDKYKNYTSQELDKYLGGRRDSLGIHVDKADTDRNYIPIQNFSEKYKKIVDEYIDDNQSDLSQVEIEYLKEKVKSLKNE